MCSWLDAPGVHRPRLDTAARRLEQESVQERGGIVPQEGGCLEGQEQKHRAAEGPGSSPGAQAGVWRHPDLPAGRCCWRLVGGGQGWSRHRMAVPEEPRGAHSCSPGPVLPAVPTHTPECIVPGTSALPLCRMSCSNRLGFGSGMPVGEVQPSWQSDRR